MKHRTRKTLLSMKIERIKTLGDFITLLNCLNALSFLSLYSNLNIQGKTTLFNLFLQRYIFMSEKPHIKISRQRPSAFQNLQIKTHKVDLNIESDHKINNTDTEIPQKQHEKIHQSHQVKDHHENHHHGQQHDDEHEDQHGHGHGQPRTPQNQGKWKQYSTHVPIKTKVSVFILMIIVWLIAYVAVSGKKGHGAHHGAHHEAHSHDLAHDQAHDLHQPKLKKINKKKNVKNKQKVH